MDILGINMAIKRYFLQIHGTTDLPFISGNAKTIKPIAAKQYPHLYTASTDLDLIKLDDKMAPSSKEDFESLYEHIDKDKRFYVQWPGNLSEGDWVVTADFLYKYFKDKIKDDEEVEFDILAHSNGGQIARLFAQKFLDKPSIKFKIISVGTPIFTEPSPVLMPRNVDTWLQFWNSWDWQQWGGTGVKQGLYTSKSPSVSDVLDKHPMRMFKSKDLPRWRDFQLDFFSTDAHHVMMSKPYAKIICETAKPYFVPEQKVKKTHNKRVSG